MNKKISTKAKNMHDDGVMNFFMAACVLAANDYRAAAASGDTEMMEECEQFFLEHPAFRALHIDGRKIVSRLRNEVNAAALA